MCLKTGDVALVAQTLKALEEKLQRLAGLHDKGRELRMRHEMTVRANAEQRVRLAAAYGEDMLGEPAEELEAVLAGFGAPEDDQSELRQLARERDVRPPFRSET